MPRMPKEEVRKQLAAVVAQVPEDMRLLRLTIQNVQKIKFADIAPKGNVIVVGGRNGQGKSSALKSIGYLLCGGELMPTDVIRSGEKWATITGQLGPFKITRGFTRKRPEDGRNNLWYKSWIKVTGPMGEEYPRRRILLDMLMNELSFDPMAFMRMPPREQFETLNKMASFEIDLPELDAAQAADYEARREARYKAEAMEARLKAALPLQCAECEGVGDIGTKWCETCKRLGRVAGELPAAMEADPSELAKRLEEASAHNAGVERARAEKGRLEALVTQATIQAQELRLEAAQLLRKAFALDGSHYGVDMVPIAQEDADHQSIAEQRLEEASKIVIEDEIDTAEVSAQLQAALANQAAIEKYKAAAALMVEWEGAWAAWAEIDERMKTRIEARTAAMQKAGLPVDGLTIGDGEVYYNGLPFNQASGAEQIRISLAIGMANHPKLKILRFMDGGWDQLDEESQALVRSEVETHRFQLWAEHVGKGPGVTVLMEEGMASGSDVEVSQPAAAAPEPAGDEEESQ
jgi:hypothetical protein